MLLTPKMGLYILQREQKYTRRLIHSSIHSFIEIVVLVILNLLNVLFFHLVKNVMYLVTLFLYKQHLQHELFHILTV